VAGLLEVTVEERAGVYVIHATGEVDISTAAELREQLDAAPADATRVVADLGGVSFLDSTGLGVLISTHKRLEEGAAGGLELVISARPVLKVLEVTGLLGLFTVHETLDAALAG